MKAYLFRIPKSLTLWRFVSMKNFNVMQWALKQLTFYEYDTPLSVTPIPTISMNEQTLQHFCSCIERASWK